MKKSTLRTMMCAVAAVGILVVQQRSMAAPAIYTWNQTAAGPFSWDYVASDNWDQSVGEPNTTYPNAAGQTANITTALTASQTINVPAGGVTVGTLTLGATSGTFIYTLQGGPITMSFGGSGASINRPATSTPAAGTYDLIKANLVMNDDLTINVGASRNLRQTGGTMTGNHNLIINGVTGNTGTFYLGRANSYAGTTTVVRGKLQISGGNANNTVPGDLIVNSGATLQSMDYNEISTSALVTVNGTWNTGGVASETPGALAGSGTIGSVAALTLLGATSAPNADFAGTMPDGIPLTISMPATSSQTLSGTAANATGAVVINSGHLILNKGPVIGGGGVNAIATSLRINGGEVKLLRPDQIPDTAPVTFAGGTFNSNGLSETMATLTNSGTSTIDMGAGASILTFANSSGQTWSGSIQILNWSGLTAGGGTDQLFFGANASGLTNAQLATMSFVNPAGYAPGTYGAKILPTGEVVVPEPAILGMLAASGLLALRRRRVRA